jgi:DNA-binding NarL/FixJ family response regulator
LNLKRLRILIADDHELVRHGIRALLQSRHEWKVVGEAVNGLEAVEKAKKLKPEVAILDIGMPDLDGLAATRQLRKDTPNTKTVILTMHNSPVMVRRALEVGACGYVLKSDLRKDLVEAVKSVSRGRLFLTPKVSDIVLSAFIQSEKESNSKERAEAKPSVRELEIIRHLAEGKVNKEIAAELGITVRTVETHRTRIMLKLGVHSVVQLIHYAIRHRLIPVANDTTIRV